MEGKGSSEAGWTKNNLMEEKVQAKQVGPKTTRWREKVQAKQVGPKFNPMEEKVQVKQVRPKFKSKLFNVRFLLFMS